MGRFFWKQSKDTAKTHTDNSFRKKMPSFFGVDNTG